MTIMQPNDEEYRLAIGRAPRRRDRGFTMIEMMVAVGIIAVLTGLAVPPLLSMVASQRVKAATFDLFSALSLARSEAIKRNAEVTVAPRSGAYTNGYDLVAGGTVLRSYAAAAGVSVTTPSGPALAFDGYGRLATLTTYQFELTSIQVSSVPKRCIIISATGRPAIRVDSNRDGNCVNG